VLGVLCLYAVTAGSDLVLGGKINKEGNTEMRENILLVIDTLPMSGFVNKI
jgi:hypothetical protein